MLYLLMKHCVSCLIYYVRLTLIRNEMVLLFSLHTQLARDAGSKNSFKFRCVGPACYGHDAFWPSPRIARFLPASCPVQRSSVEVTSKFRPSHFPWWRLTSIDLQCEYSGILFLSPQQRKQRRVTSAAGFVRKYIPINFKINIKSAYYKNL